ncbi:PD-(D/E)XK nuclease family protein [Bacillus sp. REN16]|uniref:PD-(D/E)XK nuclease family protein n=1 Tax=Bacillus sp. REN16 TaxID=2887296 RepID=UPI001E3E2EEF|nr:PD-(D/E)XK nuclease family protein [Bacillus sp. REN16]MCC3358616.1 PD-(D/E)XK nuclease family protein [Bacillus sp. REN16]
MEVLIKHLETICKQHFFTEKILLVDSYMIGEQILRQFTQKNNHAINIKIKTIKDLALDTTANLQNNHMSDALGTHLMFTLLTELKDNLNYFHEVEITPTFSRSMYQTVKKLRLAGYRSSTLVKEQFVSPSKGEDMILILETYEQLLHKNKLSDEADFYQNALGKYHSRNHIFILQSNLRLTYVQMEFLKVALPTTCFHLPLEAVHGIAVPESSAFSKIVFGAETPLSYLFDVENSPNTVPSLFLFSAKTEETELKEVLFRIKEKDIRFDEAAIFYTSSAKYATAMYHIAERLQVPVTFGEGIPIGFTKPGKMVAGILDWIKDYYSVQAFLKLLQENLLDLEEDAPSKRKWATLLRRANISWGKERYLSQIQAKMNDASEPENRIGDYHWLFQWFSTTFKHMPTAQGDGTILYGDLLKTIKYFLMNYCKISSGFDQAAKEVLLERIEDLLPYGNEAVSHAWQKFEEDFLSIHIGQSRPKPGYLHISSYKNGLYLNRKHLFIVGLDNGRFPGKSGEDPLLLDTERERLGRLLPFEKEKSKRDIYAMAQLFASAADNEITVSYCRYDMNENRAISPSYLFLQCYRIQTGEHSADFNTVQKKAPIANRAGTLENEDWWYEKITNSQNGRLDEAFLADFSNITRGLYAEKMRQEPGFTVYEGKVESDTTMFDPRKKPDITISAGKLEKIAKCPYAYFLENVLRLRVVEDVSYDPTKWLDAKTRGTLLHEIFEKFYQEIKIRCEKPSYTKHIDLLTKIANKRMDNVKTVVPAPNARTERLETEEIIESCETFLKVEEENSELGEPLYFEYSFGEDAPAVIVLPSGTVHVRGIIDRVDQLSDGSFHIIDYKTGSSWGYHTKEFFKGGRQLQHLLYTLAIEAHLGIDGGSVKKSSYLFPTRKGAGKRFVREQEETTRTNGIDILDKLLSIVGHGHFTMTDDENECKFCDFKKVCRRSTYNKDALKQKQQDETAEGLKSFKGVRAYD